jgi:hypothetical protein
MDFEPGWDEEEEDQEAVGVTSSNRFKKKSQSGKVKEAQSNYDQ